jgi:hypothetical protein
MNARTGQHPATEMSPLFHVMNNIQYQYTEIQDDDEEEVKAGDSKKKVNSNGGNTSTTKAAAVPRSPLFLNRNGWFSRKLDGSDQNHDKEKDSTSPPHLAVLFVAVLICIGLGIAITSMGTAPTPKNPISDRGDGDFSWNGDGGDSGMVTSEATKLTLIPVATVGNARSVKVVTWADDRVSPETEIELATGVYITNYENNGWNHLRVHMPNIELTNDYDYFARYFMGWEAMGFLEGYVTCEEMQSFYVNLYHGLFDGGDIVPGAVTFLIENHDWVRGQAEANWRTSEYWLAVKATLVQLTGVLNGLRAGCPSAAGGSTVFDAYTATSLRTLHDGPTLVNLLILQANGDLYQIAAKYNQQDQPAAKDDDYQYTNPPPKSNSSTFFDDDNHLKSQYRGPLSAKRMFDEHMQRIRSRNLGESPSAQSAEATSQEDSEISKISPRERQHIGSDHCSALIRLLPDYSDVLFAHNTWDDFQNAAPRIFKEYSFPQPHYRRAQGITTATGNGNGLSGDGHKGGNINNGENSPGYVGAQPAPSQSTTATRRKLGDSNGSNKYNNGNNGNNMRGGESGGNKAPTSAPSPVPPTETYSILSSTMVNIHFSSSPGFLTSVDDFYTISGNGNLAVIETSLDIYDGTLLTEIHYDTVLSWMRYVLHPGT